MKVHRLNPAVDGTTLPSPDLLRTACGILIAYDATPSHPGPPNVWFKSDNGRWITVLRSQPGITCERCAEPRKVAIPKVLDFTVSAYDIEGSTRFTASKCAIATAIYMKYRRRGMTSVHVTPAGNWVNWDAQCRWKGRYISPGGYEIEEITRTDYEVSHKAMDWIRRWECKEPVGPVRFRFKKVSE